jgi:hypothetical protein
MRRLKGGHSGSDWLQVAGLIDHHGGPGHFCDLIQSIRLLIASANSLQNQLKDLGFEQPMV